MTEQRTINVEKSRDNCSWYVNLFIIKIIFTKLINVISLLL